MALSHSKLNQKSKAISAYRKAIAGFRQWKRPHPDMYYYLGNSYYYLDQVQEAISAYQEAIQLRPTFAQPHLNLGLVYAATGNKKAALDEYTILRSIDSKRAKRLFNVIYPKR
jgi:tetratricopeptide (TPR) repeat protein